MQSLLAGVAPKTASPCPSSPAMAGSLALRHLRHLARPAEALVSTSSKRLGLRSAATVTEDFVPAETYEPAPLIQTIQFDLRNQNSIALLGNLGQDVQLRTTPNGKHVANLRLAVKRKEETDWHNVDCFGDLAVAAQQQLAKGSRVQVFGFSVIDKYVDKAGAERVGFKVVATTLCHVERTAMAMDGQAPPQVAQQQVQFQQQYQEPYQGGYVAEGGQQGGYAQQGAPQAEASPEELWADVMKNPQAWWDNRESKRNPNGPDFKQKDGQQKALWIDSRTTPAWVPDALKERDGAGSVRM